MHRNTYRNENQIRKSLLPIWDTYTKPYKLLQVYSILSKNRKALNHGLKIFRDFLLMDLLNIDLHESERAYKK